jgi:hypothetical protein
MADDEVFEASVCGIVCYVAAPDGVPSPIGRALGIRVGGLTASPALKGAATALSRPMATQRQQA